MNIEFVVSLLGLVNRTRYQPQAAFIQKGVLACTVLTELQSVTGTQTDGHLCHS